MHVRRQHQRFCSSVSFGVGYPHKVDIYVGFPAGFLKVLIEKIRYTSLSRAHSWANCRRISESRFQSPGSQQRFQTASEGFAQAARKCYREVLLSQNALRVGVFSSGTSVPVLQAPWERWHLWCIGCSQVTASIYLHGPGGYADTWAIAVLLDTPSALLKKTRGQDFKESTLQIIRLAQWISCQKF